MTSIDDYECDIDEACPPEVCAPIAPPPTVPTEGNDKSQNLYRLYRAAWMAGRDAKQEGMDKETAKEKRLYPMITDAINNCPDDTTVPEKAETAFDKGYACPRLLTDAPEEVAKAIRWRRENVGELRKREAEKYITKSQTYVALTYMLYGLGHHGGTFPFAERRIGNAYSSIGYKFCSKTVFNFIKWAESNGYVDVVQEGRPSTVQNGGKGLPKILRIRQDNLQDLIHTFGMDETSKAPASKGVSFADYIEATGLPFEHDTLRLQPCAAAVSSSAI